MDSRFWSPIQIRVMLASFVAYVFCFSYPYSFGVIDEDIQTTFDITPVLADSVVTAFHGIIFIPAIACGAICRKFGASLTIALGGFILSVGLFASFFVTRIYFLFVSLSLLGGFSWGLYVTTNGDRLAFVLGAGCSLLLVGGSVSLVDSFGKHSALALSINSLLSGGCLIVMQHVHPILVQHYGVNGSFLIFAGLSLNNFPAAMIVWYAERSSSGEFRETSAQLLVPYRDIMSNVKFIFWLIFAIILTSSAPYPLLLLLNYTRELGYSKSHGEWVTSAYSIASLPGRLVMPIVVRSIRRYLTLFLIATCAVFGVFIMLYAYVSSLEMLFLNALFSGALHGVLVTAFSVALVEISGEDAYSQSYGISCSIGGCGVLASGPVYGSFMHIYGSYSYSFLAAGVTTICVCVIMGCLEFAWNVFKSHKSDIKGRELTKYGGIELTQSD